MSTPEIAQAIEGFPFEAKTEALLEQHVAKQLHSGTYDFVANKALLKCYQCHANPSGKLEIIVEVLVLSLMRLPSTDFLALSYLVPGGNKPPSAANEKLVLVQKYAELLEKSLYKEFWAEFATSGSTFSLAVGFEGAMRQCIVLTMSLAFRDVSMEVLAPMVGLGPDALQAYLKQCALVEAVTDSSVRFLPNDQNTGGPRNVDAASLKLDRMKQLFKFSA